MGTVIYERLLQVNFSDMETGKSNLLDAISFCLTVDIKSLRVQSVRDLIFRGAPEATVSLVFEANGKLSNSESSAELHCRIFG